MEAPIPLLTVDDKGKFHIGTKAIEILAKIQGNVAIVAIAGIYRTGKSYVLNRLLGRSTGFEIGGSVQACTKGIYIWGQPISATNADGEKVSIILVDTEGIGSIDQNATHDTKILSLSVLLSSLFIYNSMGVIDENALEKISFIANLTKHIAFNTPGAQAGPKPKESEMRELAPYFPRFIWLLRDFGLKLVDTNNNPITQKEYLEMALSQRTSEESKNEIRRGIQNAFAYRDCYTLVRPVVEEDALQTLDKIPYEELRDKFRTGMDELIKKVFKESISKKVAGRPINGGGFIVLMKTYVDAINSGAVPTIKSAWDNVSDSECQGAMDEAIKIYIEGGAVVAQKFPLDHDEMHEQHENLVELAVAEYQKRALGDMISKYREKLEERLNEEFVKLQRKNDEVSEKTCKALLEKLFGDIESPLKAKKYTNSSDLLADFKSLNAKYLAQAKGRYKYIALAEFFLGRMADSFLVMEDQLIETLKKQHNDQIDEKKKEIQEQKDEKKQQKEEFERQRKELEGNLNRTQRELERTDKVMKKLEEENKELQDKIKELQAKLGGNYKEEPKGVSGTTVVDGKKKKKDCVIV